MGQAWSASYMVTAPAEVKVNQAVGCIPGLSTAYGLPSALVYHFFGDHSEASRRWTQSVPLVGNLVHVNFAMLQESYAAFTAEGDCTDLLSEAFVGDEPMPALA